MRIKIIVIAILFLLVSVLCFCYFRSRAVKPSVLPGKQSQQLLTAEEQKAEMLEKLNNLTDQSRRAELERMTPEEKVRLKQEMLNKLNNLAD